MRRYSGNSYLMQDNTYTKDVLFDINSFSTPLQPYIVTRIAYYCFLGIQRFPWNSSYASSYFFTLLIYLSTKSSSSLPQIEMIQFEVNLNLTSSGR